MTPTSEATLAVGSAAPVAGMATGYDAIDDLELVEQTKKGNQEAFSELVRRHQQVTYNLAYRYMRDATQAEDMAQEAFLKAFRLLNGFRGDSSFSTWLYRVTCSAAGRGGAPTGPLQECGNTAFVYRGHPRPHPAMRHQAF